MSDNPDGYIYDPETDSYRPVVRFTQPMRVLFWRDGKPVVIDAETERVVSGPDGPDPE